jgi:hypothetical protein
MGGDVIHLQLVAVRRAGDAEDLHVINLLGDDGDDKLFAVVGGVGLGDQVAAAVEHPECEVAGGIGEERVDDELSGVVRGDAEEVGVSGVDRQRVDADAGVGAEIGGGGDAVIGLESICAEQRAVLERFAVHVRAKDVLMTRRTQSGATAEH